MPVQHESRATLIAELATELADGTPALDATGQRIAVALYRLLAQGGPVTSDALAARIGVARANVEGVLDSLPGVYRDDDAAVIGFWGLSVTPMPHRLVVGGRTLYSWCAWDALFIPPILGEPARVESTCAVSGDPITLRVTPQGVAAVSPPTTALSMLRPDGGLGDDVISSFCHHIRFFRSAHEAESWTATRAGTLVLSLREGFRLGQLTWRARLGAALDPLPAAEEVA
ncbi:MAG TPA: organomercurial lyase [Gaiellales bacterium]|jgi:alkylmercury lyase|nr:organomercurial lyase [Gaiellales bacterium]